MKIINILAIMLVFLVLFIPFALADEKDDKLDKIDKKMEEIFDKIRNSDIQLEIFGTEYTIGDDAIIWLQILRNFVPINNATCYVTAYYPNKTIFIDGEIMFYLNGSDAVYYYDTVVPEIMGVYMLSAACYLPQQAYVDDFLDLTGIQFSENITVTDGKLHILDSTVGAGNASGRSGAIFGLDKAGGVYSYMENGTLEWSDTGFKSEDLEAVDFDHDGSPDDVIAASDALEIIVYNETGGEICSYVTGFAIKTVAAADFDEDDIVNEPIAGTGGLDDMIYALNETCDLLWNYSAGADVSDIQSIDLDGDGYMDEVVAALSGGDVIALWSNGTLAWTVTKGVSNFKYLTVADADHDGILDHTYAGSEDDNVYLIDETGSDVCSFAAGGNIKVMDTLDHDNSGYQDDACVSSDDNTIYLINESCDEVWSFTESPIFKFKTCAAADFDGDMNLSDVFAGGESGILYAFYGNGTQRWNISLGNKIKERTIAAADFHGTGSLDDAIVGTETTGYGIHFNGTIEWSNVLADKAKAVVAVSFFEETFSYVQGFAQSINITLGSRWQEFASTYDNKSGDTYFEIRNSSNGTICTSLGDIGSCANITSPVTMWVNLTRPNLTASSPEIDSWFLSWVTSEIEEIRGAGEMHVTDIPAGVWRYANRNLTYYEDVTNYEYIQSMVWNTTVRSLTDYNNTVIIDEMRGLANLTDDEVWSYVNRTLTDFNFTVNATLTAEAIWKYQDRNLTFYNQSEMWAYFAYWNDSLYLKWDNYFYLWNNSYFDSWNDTLEGALPADFRRVWEEFNCTTSPENTMCQRLATCSAITCGSGISSGGTPVETVLGLDEHIVSLIQERDTVLVGGFIETTSEILYNNILIIVLIILVSVALFYYALKRGIKDAVKQILRRDKRKKEKRMNIDDVLG